MPILHWVGKDKVVNHHYDVPFRLLKKNYTFNANEGTPQNSTDNRIIYGDNLEALKSLLPEFEGKIKCIYIDPPYNTGNEGWVYNDNVNDPKIKKWLGEVVGKEGEDLSRHDKWLCMMYPRLKLLYRLLADDGVIFISIDDNEYISLESICSEIFGLKNKISTLVWDLGTGTQAGHFVRSHEYVLVYAKNKEQVDNFSGGEGEIEHSALKKISIKNPQSEFTFPVGTRFDAPDNFELTNSWGESEKTYLVSGKMIAQNGKITNEVTLSAGWAQKRQMEDWFSGKKTIDSKGQTVKEFYFNKNGVLRYKKDRSVLNPPTVLRNIANTKNGSSLLESILGKSAFDFPKPLDLIFFLLKLTLNLNKNAIILDSFAGSGTTAHAVLQLNAEDGGNRRFICIEMMDYAETITAERVRRVINGYGEESKAVVGLGGGFDFYTVDAPLFLEDKNLNEEVGVEAIRDYVAYTESIPTVQQTAMDNDISPYTLGLNDEALYVFYYEKERITTLDMEFLASLKISALTTRPSHYIIYADKCVLEKEFMLKHSITFKRIPRDITRF